jgi:hypothetical protein
MWAHLVREKRRKLVWFWFSFGFSLAAILAILTRVMNVTLKREQAMLRNLGQTFDGASSSALRNLGQTFDGASSSASDDDEG